jgi:hypothetical protein
MKPLFGLMAEFKDPKELLSAARRTLSSGYREFDTYTPFPIDDLDEAIGFRKNRVPLIVLLGGTLGGVTGFVMQWFAYSIEYPMNIAGRPDFSWPSFIPVTFELTVLGAALFGVIGMLVLNGLPEPYHPLFDAEQFDRASKDRFFLCIQQEDPRFDAAHTRFFLESLSPERVVEVFENEGAA